MAARKTSANGTNRSVAASVLTQEDADRFGRSAEKFAKKATTSRQEARRTLVSLRTHTKSGRIAKNYS